jgi:hypothetical protein
MNIFFFFAGMSKPLQWYSHFFTFTAYQYVHYNRIDGVNRKYYSELI